MKNPDHELKNKQRWSIETINKLQYQIKPWILAQNVLLKQQSSSLNFLERDFFLTDVNCNSFASLQDNYTYVSLSGWKG